MTEDSAASYDAVIIGGGPAGASVAGLLALRGHRVMILEKEKFPRYHIGESLTTGTLPALDELGVRDRMNALGFTKKYGGSLLWGADVGVWDFRFVDAEVYDHSYQVRRADFDAMLLGRARELGVEVNEEATFRDAVVEDGRIVGATYTLKDAEPRTVRCSVLVDASGQAKTLARRFDVVDWHEDLRNIATWTYFQGAKRLEGTRSGDTLSESRPNGWIWYIPLSDGTTSVGYVTSTAALKESGRTPQQLFEEQLAGADEVGRLLDGARRVSGFRTARDWSYTCRELHGPGWALVGDAAAFVDPLMSSGVSMAMRAAKGLASSLDWVLRNPDDEAAVMKQYQADYHQFAGNLVEFIRFFYDRTLNRAEYWDKAQEVIDPERNLPSRRDFATILSGMAGLHEVFLPPTRVRPEPDTAAEPDERPASWTFFE